MSLELIHLYHQAEDYFFRSVSKECFSLYDGAKAYMTGVPVADLNLIYVQNTKALDKILSAGKQFYDQHNLPFVVIIPQEFCTTAIENVLNLMGYHQTYESVSMGIKLEDFTANNTVNFDDGVIIRSNDDQLSDWMNPLIGAFESTFEISSMYMATHEVALKKNINLRHFSMYKQEKPIASITLSLHSGIARIDDVGTLPEFQGKGYATRLMTYVLSEAKRSGAHHCFLESSDSGLGVYKKLGFKLLFKNNIYSRKA